MSLQAIKCKLCRREGNKLFLKGERCFGVKCAFTRRSYAPGQNGKKFAGKSSDYGKQLRAKQACKRTYKIRERVLSKYYNIAAKSKGATGERILQILETRFDNVLYRLGMAESRSHAQQIINHGHTLINGKKVDIPSYNLKLNDKISFDDKTKKSSKNTNNKNIIPLWMQFNKEKHEATILRIPTKDEIQTDIDITLIVEFYSR